ncbi:1-acyl-sn-glycerol-3-phosphate acyltransferase [Anaplasma platys]|uniref:1-acyl-sn-glycerol-3-phosphate acyltransferase n=1 Tax=Anaplasma platys TaxID=949 RepID=A0A858PZI3_9RICK|nr:lysophospholipid acyltransferase family protein [Anaplasma platys]QJC27967.1 1-acyl-sn-glycerol-3-phosphate acyltransferase [Anaplasma platys]
MITLPIALSFRGRVACALGRVGMKGLLWICQICEGITYEVVGRENLPNGPFIVGAEHQSALDPMILYVELNCPSFILKQELKKFPVLGLWFTLCGSMYIDRSQKVAALKKMIRECRKKYEDGKVIALFPAGTRSTEAPSDKQYQEGITAIYHALQVPVVPVMLNTGKFWPGAIISLGKKPGKATLKIMPPIKPGLERKAFMKEFKNSMVEGEGNLCESWQ